MARIDFVFGVKHRLNAACEVVQKNYLAGHKVIIYTKDERRLNRFNNLLWSFNRTSFVPHTFCTDSISEQAPVVLTTQPPALLLGNNQSQQPILLNLDLECPPQANKFELILEVVSNHEEDKAAARQRWVAYKLAGHQIQAQQ